MFGKQIAHLKKEYSAQIKWGKLANLVTPDCSEDIKDAMTTSYADWVSFVGTSFTTAGILGRYKAYTDAEDVIAGMILSGHIGFNSPAGASHTRQFDVGRFVRSGKKQGIVIDYAAHITPATPKHDNNELSDAVMRVGAYLDRRSNRKPSESDLIDYFGQERLTVTDLRRLVNELRKSARITEKPATPKHDD